MMTHILVVDDSSIDRRLVEFFLKKGIADVSVSSADNGQSALAVIASNVPDLIITDLQMPEMDGLKLVENIKSGGIGVPVILMTGDGNEQIAFQALKTGAASYVPKRAIDKNLVETVKSVLSVSRWQPNPQRALSTLECVESRFSLGNDTSLISPLVAYLQEQLEAMQFSDKLQMTQIGMAIHESLTNAIYYGNLELDSELRQTDSVNFYRQLEERRRDERYASRKVRLSARFSKSEVRLVVSDDGFGYESAEFRNSINEMKLDRTGGRGLLLIDSFMDEVSHNSKGNEITMVKRHLNSDSTSAATNAAS
jgi:CheY-like chemotaxis protein